MRKFLFGFLFFAILANATTIKTQQRVYDEGQYIRVSVTEMAGGSKDWIGIYPEGASNDWGNVVDWKWTGGITEGNIFFSGIKTSGSYEARAFFNNSFHTEASYTFSVKSLDQTTTISTQKEIYSPDEAVTVTLSNMIGDDQDWVAIYPKGASNDWGNVLSWRWTGGIKNGDVTLSGVAAEGEYEVRAFFNNSYHTEAIDTFQVLKQEPMSSIKVNEVMASNAHTIIDPDFSAFSDWIELYNSSEQSVDIGGYKLSDTVDEALWTIPDGTVIPAKGYMIFWADEEDTTLENFHTNFKLSGKGEAVALFDREGQLVDSLVFGKQKADISCVHDGDNVAYTLPSPKQKNSLKIDTLSLSDVPTFSVAGGFYDNSQNVTLSGANGAKIYYTTDGSYPTIHAKRYQEPITIDETTMVRAISVEDGKFPSQGVTHTYFINESSTLPVISLTTDNKYLFDDMIGIYTVGANGADKVCGEGQANYMQDWDRPANIEFFDKDKNIGFNQEVTISMSGTCSLERAEKSFSIKADKIYGKKNIAYKIFPDKDIDKFKSIKLRNGGQDWHKAMMRDAMMQRLIKDDTDLDYQAYQPALLFLNGQYWGIYNIREKKNEDYLAANHPGLDDKKVDILYGPSAKVKEGDNIDYKNLIAYLNNHSLVSDENYQVVANQVDIDNYIDYLIVGTYVANYDWLYNNIRYYKEKKDGAKWRWILDDLDSGFNLNYSDPDEFGLHHNTIAYALSEPTEDPAQSWRNKPAYTILTRKLMENATFKDKFIARYHVMLDTTFAPQRVNAMIAQMKAVIEPEMARHIQRWQDDGGYGYAIGYSGKSNWDRYVGYLNEFANDRPDIVRGHLQLLGQ